jgi:hypothetical protein
MSDSPSRHDPSSTPAGIAYHGIAGSSSDCLHAVMQLVHSRRTLSNVRILTSHQDHAILLEEDGDSIAIKSGFGSGYGGAGPHAFSTAIGLLRALKLDLQEIDVDAALLERLDLSALTEADLTWIEAQRPVRPSRWPDYLREEHWSPPANATLWGDVPCVMPLGVIDLRLLDLALDFWQGPDERLVSGYRRLEDIVRSRTRLEEHGANLFSQAFVGPDAPLHWPGLDSGAQTGRGQLFAATFMAYRNPRAHRELGGTDEAHLGEFVLLNQLFRLEHEAVSRSANELGASPRSPA